MRRLDAAFFLTCAAAAAWAGCDAIAGIQSGVAAPADASSGDGNGSSSSGGGDAMGSGDGPREAAGDAAQDTTGSDAPMEAEGTPPLGDCGDMSGLQAGSPWPMEGRCPSHAGRSDGKGPASATVQWRISLPGDPVGVSVAADGTIYVCASSSGLTAHLPGDGSQKSWTFSDCVGTPAVAADGTLYVPGGSGTLYAVDPGSGAKKWALALGGDGPVTSPTVGPDGTIYAAAATVLCAVKSDGTKLWTFQANGTIVDGVALGPSGVIYAPGDVLYAVKPDGTQKWTENLGVSLTSSPVVDKDENIYLGAGTPTAVSPTGTRTWSMGIGGNVAGAPALGTGNIVYFGAFAGAFAALDRATGSVIWQNTAGDSITRALAADSMGSVYFGCNNKDVYGYDHTGALLFTGMEMGAGVTQPVIGAGGVLYAGGGIYASEVVALGP